MNNDNKELLFSVTASDCEWSYTKGSGKGGQKRNKTSSAVHCRHKASGATGYADDTRSQRENKCKAFWRMTQTSKFKEWHRLETMRIMGQLDDINKRIKKEMRNIKVEVKEGKKWKEVNKDDLLIEKEK